MLNPLRPLVDGFLYNLYTRYWMERFSPLALASLETLRRARTYRLHQYTVPDSQNLIIPARDTFRMQVAIVSGSFWWGTSFVAMDPTTYASVDPAHQFLVRITESCNDVGAMDDFAFAEMYSLFNSPFSIPILNTTPRPIVEPALLNVEIANITASALPCQLVLWVAEPCEIPEGMLTECENVNGRQRP